MGSDYTLILIDGKKQNNSGDIYPNSFEGAQLASIPPLSMIERIEVIRGPMSTLYGSDAMGGVINIITKKSKEGTFTNISTEYGSYNFKKVNAGVSHKNKKFDAKLNVLRVDTDGFTSISPKGSDIDDFED